MYDEKIVKINHNLEKSMVSILMFLNFQNKIEMEFESINKRLEDLNRKIDEQHLENIHSDEILLEFCRKWALQKQHGSIASNYD